MPTSKKQGAAVSQTRGGRAKLRAIFAEAAVAAAAAVMLAALLSPVALGLGTLAPHPVWLAVVALAARYGGRGLAVGAPVAWGALVLAALGLRVGPAIVLDRLSTGPDLCAFAAVVLVSWIASMHERRHVEAGQKLVELERRCTADREALDALRGAAVVLRARADRLDTSLTFLRDVAMRLAGNDPEVAAQAALELATARLGARAAVLHTVAGAGAGAGGAEAGNLIPLASAGTWAPGGHLAGGGGGAAGGAVGDRTAAAVMRTLRPARALDLPEGGPDDSDLGGPDPRRGGAPGRHHRRARRPAGRGQRGGAARAGHHRQLGGARGAASGVARTTAPPRSPPRRSSPRPRRTCPRSPPEPTARRSRPGWTASAAMSRGSPRRPGGPSRRYRPETQTRKLA